ncbi:class I SAM-dependent DNA methyltransferase [Streptomyces californicus]|uniref:class I SAM-dependent DNA methyltransferase n=1 Tax=Streptomyces californicus TaxID=67351 RepID=UPI0033E6969A
MIGDEDGARTDFFWSVADLLRGKVRAIDYGSVVLPFTVLRRMDCLRQRKAGQLHAVTGTDSHDAAASSEVTSTVGGKEGCKTGDISHPPTEEGSGQGSPSIPDDPRFTNGLSGLLRNADVPLSENVHQFVQGFPADVVEVLDSFGFKETIQLLAKTGILKAVVSRFAELDLSPTAVSDQQMGQKYEDLLRRFDEASPEILGEFTSPQDVSSLTTRLLLGPDLPALAHALSPIRLYDPCCGTGSLLSAAEVVLRGAGSSSELVVTGQEINQHTYAIARSVRMMKGADPSGIVQGDVLTDDRHRGETFDYLLAAPPIGLEWRRQQEEVMREARELGPDGRFGAGTPMTSDSSLLFVQHVVAHMQPADRGGARAAVLLSASPLHRGGAGSGESEIRRWLLERELLEGVVALPGQLWPNSKVPMYIWLLTNRKQPQLRGKIIALDARDQCATLRRPLGSRQHYITDQHISQVAQRYEAALRAEVGEERAADGDDTALLLDVAELGYRAFTVDQPLRQHFTVSTGTVGTVESAKALTRFDGADSLVRALRALTGGTWRTWTAFESDFTTALQDAGLQVPLARPLQILVRSVVAVPDPEGEVQTDGRGRKMPDLELRHHVRVPLHQDVQKFMQREITPEYPDAWTDPNSSRIGYALPQAPFLTSRPGTGFGPLSTVARKVPTRPFTREAAEGVPLLRGRDLQTATTAADLPDASDTDDFNWRVQSLAACTGGDVVGQSGNWRLLPPEFGDAATLLTVLRPIGHSGRALCEWLRTGANEEGTVVSRLSMYSPVPVALIKDPTFNALLEDLDSGRTALSNSTSRILPTVFRNPRAGIDEVRRAARAAASEARIIGELSKPLGDPVWRAEWSYPYHVAALARQHRTATTLAQRKDALLKLGESVARCVGVLSLAVLIDRQQSFTKALRRPFTLGDGVTFGKWNNQITALVDAGPIPELPELEGALDAVGAVGPLTQLAGMRNHSGHKTRVQPEHELEREVSALERVVVAALEAVGWLSSLHWDLVDACAYIGKGQFAVTGRRLRGSHPDWEPFERPRAGTVEPNRIYVEGLSSTALLDLWPVARVEVCPECDTRELFLLHKIEDKTRVMTLRCGRDHEIDRAIT